MGRCWGTIGLGQMANRLFGARAAFVKLWRVEGPINYGQQQTPGLSQDDFAWVQKIIRK
jgi:hypothetical protein